MRIVKKKRPITTSKQWRAIDALNVDEKLDKFFGKTGYKGFPRDWMNKRIFKKPIDK